MASLHEREAPVPGAAPPSDEAFLDWLGGPTLLRQRGRDRSRVRAVATLLHGNEPSGLRALRAWLASAETPATDALFFVGSVAAARTAPGFAHRSLPGRPDLNRCFAPPFPGEEGALARELLTALRAAGPEALIDLHNNTGRNPAYGVVCGTDPLRLALVGLFARRCVRSDLQLGTLVEALDGELPAVTVECGRAGDPVADVTAFAGLSRYLRAERLGADPGHGLPFQVLVDPVRVRLREGVRLAFADGPVDGADLTFAADVDRHNFERVVAGTVLGWLRPGAPWPLDARGADGAERSRALFAVEAGAVRFRSTGVPVMMTTDPAVAASDCLFYLTRSGA